MLDHKVAGFSFLKDSGIYVGPERQDSTLRFLTVHDLQTLIWVIMLKTLPDLSVYVILQSQQPVHSLFSVRPSSLNVCCCLYNLI